jgi:hypothetical protein
MENHNVLNLNQSDKLFWHGYIEFYERFFINRKIETIAEIGVFKGESIKWLLHRFPTAKNLWSRHIAI